MTTEFVIDGRLSMRPGTKNMLSFYGITTQKYNPSIPVDTRGGFAIKFPANMKVGLLRMSYYDVVGAATNRLWNMTLYPTERHDEVLALDQTTSYIPQVLWSWKDTKILEMMNVVKATTGYLDLSAYKDAEIDGLSLFIHNSCVGDGTQDYFEIALNGVAIEKYSENPDPIVY